MAGYKAVLVAAHAYGGFFPVLVTAAGTARPAGCWSSARGSPGCRPSVPSGGWVPW